MNFADPGVWVWQVQNCDYNRIKAIADCGFRWIAIQIVSGQDAYVNGDYADLIASARSLGLEVAGFGWLVDQPELEAEAADRQLAAWGLDGYIANGEKSLGYTQDWGACPDCFNYSSRWVARWLELRAGGTPGFPGFPLAFSSYCDFSTHDIHYVPWIEAGAAAMPQTYWNEFEWATPECGVQGALDVKQPWNGPPNGWPVERIHPTFANYPSGSRPVPTPEEYATNQLRTSARGFSVYLGELIESDDWDSWKAVLPSLCSTAKPPLTAEQFPYTGPYYGPSDTRGPDKGLTPKALKRALHRLGVEATFTSPDEHYSKKLEQAMSRWQGPLGISPTGQYGKGSYEAMRSAVTPSGEYALDQTALDWVKEDARS